MAPPGSSLPWPAPIGSDYQDDLAYRFQDAAECAGVGGASLAGELPRLPQGVVLRLPVRFHARAADYARLWFTNLLMLVLTLGLFWPWAQVRAQRFFMRHTTVAGMPLDYHAVPIRQLPRYAFMLALLAGVVGSWRGSPLAGLLALVLAVAVWPLGVHLSLVHQLQHTSWSGRRLAFDGQVDAVYAALLLPLSIGLMLVWLCLVASLRSQPAWWAACGFLAAVGLLGVPLYFWAYMDYRQNRLRLGPVGLAWKGTLSAMGMLWLRVAVWGGLLAALVGGLAVAVLGGALMMHLDITAMGARLLTAGVLLGVLAGVVPYSHARLQNLVWSKTGHRALRFRSSLDVRAYVVLQCRHAVWLLLTLGLYWPWATVASRRMRTQALEVWSRVDAEVLKSHWPSYGQTRSAQSIHSDAPDTRR